MALLLSGCGAGSGSSGESSGPKNTAPAVQTAQPLPAYKPMLPATVEKVRGYSFQRPADWVHEVSNYDTDLYTFGSGAGVPSATFTFGRLDPGITADRWQVARPFDPEKVRDAWLVQQKKDALHRWQVGQTRAVSVLGLTGYRLELQGGTDKFRVDNVTYLLVGPDTILILTVQAEEAVGVFNPERWAGMMQGLDNLVTTLQLAP